MPLKTLLQWLFELPKKLNNKNTEEVKIIISEVKDLRDYYKAEFKEQLANSKEQAAISKEQTAQITEQARQIEELRRQVQHMQEMEQRCLEGQVVLQGSLRDVLEKLIFKTKGKHKGDEI